MSTTNVTAGQIVKVKEFDCSNITSIEFLEAQRKVINDRIKTLRALQPKPTKDAAKVNRSKMATSMLDTILGMNKAYDLIKKWYNAESKTFSIPNPKTGKSEINTLSDLGIVDGNNFAFIMQKVSNFYVFFSVKKRRISPREAIDFLADATNMPETKFAELLRAGLSARAKK